LYLSILKKKVISSEKVLQFENLEQTTPSSKEEFKGIMRKDFAIQ